MLAIKKPADLIPNPPTPPESFDLEKIAAPNKSTENSTPALRDAPSAYETKNKQLAAMEKKIQEHEKELQLLEEAIIHDTQKINTAGDNPRVAAVRENILKIMKTQREALHLTIARERQLIERAQNLPVAPPPPPMGSPKQTVAVGQ